MPEALEKALAMHYKWCPEATVYQATVSAGKTADRHVLYEVRISAAHFSRDLVYWVRSDQI